MARLVVLGIGPLEFEGPKLFTGSANRVWQLARPLLDAGHQLTIICMRATGTGVYQGPERRTIHDRLTYVSLDEVTQYARDEVLQRFVDDARPQAIIAANVYPGARASALKRTVPLFVDMNGYTMGEAQAKANRENENGYLVHFYHIVCQALANAEAFAACSNRYREGLIGELTILGRPFDPNQVYTIEEAKEPIQADPQKVRAFRREFARDEEFLVLWSGGYNTWADIPTVFAALEYAMERNLKIRYVSTGGELKGHDEITYLTLLEKIAASPFRRRFTCLGWIDMEPARLAFYAAQVGINVDLDCYETRLGARNRITEMLAAGLVPITTRGAEITEIVERERLGFVTPIGDPAALGEAILYAAAHPDELRETAERAKAFARERYSYQTSAQPLLDWVARVAG